MALPEVNIGIDLTEFYMSVEWDILEVSILLVWQVTISAPVRVYHILLENAIYEGVALPVGKIGIHLTEFYMSVDWDILEVGIMTQFIAKIASWSECSPAQEKNV